MMKYIISTFIGVMWLLHASFGQYQERMFFNAKFEPESHVIHGAGQSDEFAFAGYTEVMSPSRHPMLYMEYTGANDTPEEVKEELDMYKRILSHYPEGVGLQLGLSMNSGGTGYSQDVADGVYDEGLIALAKHLDSLNRIVFVRIGYEANGFWNGYQAGPYKEAFQHVTNIFRNQTDSIATVWCVHPVDNMTEIMTYYPGDEYVDWWSIDLFQTKFITNNTTAQFMDSAEVHQKPVMIGEATPTETGVGQGQESWDNWYKVFFETIHENPVIKAFCYINRDWAYLGGQSSWGNSKLQDDPIVACLYREEMDLGLYQHAEAGIENNVSTLVSSEDAYVNSAQPETSFGGEDYLYASVTSATNDTIKTFVKFDMSDKPVGNISLAQLWLLGACDHQNNQDIDVFISGSEWDEDSLTWNNQPEIYQKAGTINVNDEGKTKIYSVDITQVLKDSILAGSTTVSFAILHPAENDVEYFFHSSEKTPEYPPTLQIIHDSEALQFDECRVIDDSRPFLIVKEEMYPNMREKASQSPWKEMKEDARRIFSQEYDSTFEDVDDKAIRIRDIISAGTLLWILEPDSQEVYQEKIINTLYQFNDVMASRNDPPTDWKSTVPLACASFNAFITLDVLYNTMPVADRDSIESLYFDFLDNQRSTAWKESYYGSLGMYYLYKRDRAKIDYHKRKYRHELELHITDDGLFTGGTGYSTSRFVKDEREQKFMFMDVLEFTDEDNYYDDPLFQQFHEWLFAHNFNTYGSIYIFGDAKMGTSIRGRLEQSPATWRVNRFSTTAAQNAAWHVQGKTPDGRLLCYLSVDSMAQPARPDTSEIYPDGGAWFVHNPSNEEHVSGVLWNPKSFTAHSHKEVNAIHLSAFGEDLVVNSGYSNWGNPALGFSWKYIHDRAKSSNTVLINNQDHSSKAGDGISHGFIIDNKLSFATGVSGPAIKNGEHKRTLQMLFPTNETPGYWVLFDEVQAFNPADNMQVLLHPRSADITTVDENIHYRWDVKRWTEHGADINLFLATPPNSVKLIDGVQADKSNSILTKVLKSTYETDDAGNAQALTVAFPEDTIHQMPAVEQIVGPHYAAANVTINDRITDYIIESEPGLPTPAITGDFTGKYLFQRIFSDSVQYLFGMDVTEYKHGQGGYTKGFSTETPFHLYLDDKTGKIQCTFSEITFYYPGIEEVLLNGVPTSIEDDGMNTLTVTVPTGVYDLEIVASGIAEQDTSTTTSLQKVKDQLDITLYPNPVNDFVYIRGMPEKTNIISAEIYNLQGKKVMDVDEIRRRNLVDVHFSRGNLPAGTYILRIRFSGNHQISTFHDKIILN